MSFYHTKRLLLLLLLSSVFLYSQEFRNIANPRSKYLYEYRDIYLSALRDSINSEIYDLEVDRENTGDLADSLFFRTLHYNIYKYRLTDIFDTLETLKNVRSELTENSYFNSRLKKWNDSTVIQYVTFAVELSVLKKYLSAFDLEDFKKTETYRFLKNRLVSESYNTDKMDSVLSRINKLGFEPINFYYRPNSIKEQYQADKFDITKFNFKELTEFTRTHAQALEKAESEYKVNREIIVAILRKETNLGKYPLKYNPFEVLLAQAQFAIENPAYDTMVRINNLKRISRLKNSAANSLYNMVKYTIDNSIDPAETKSNFVGAVGFTQFMPFNLHLAKDGNGDGRADLSNMDDAIMSIANFLNTNGWKNFYDLNSNNRRSITKLILRYNTSDSYAEAVYEIASEIKRQMK
ncbi:MAG: lytic murein transglycosylase [Candidatus Delongbacteria bacterium]|nr:lytic murein transglycosylase [Candidatus Delongbacteria bacterium]MDD4205648.1 lytic murein transglycosylase [Candidatus Delongbacteria bacterium]MDY0017300.1 lytic murein transglycosylase [Candidatus Delongbacteria bacterium]